MDKSLHVRLRTIRIIMLVMTVVFMREASIHAELAEAESSSDKSPSANVSNALKQLQGKWKPVKSNYNDASYCDGLAIRFRDDKVIEIMPSKNKEQSEEEVLQCNFTVDESKNPMWIDVGQRKGIFRIEDDLVIVCFGDKKHRPTKFILVTTTDVSPVAAPPAYPMIPTRAPGVGFWVPFEISWDQDNWGPNDTE